MSTATPATQALQRAGVAFWPIEYAYVAGQDRIGLHAAEAIGADPGRVLKTLMVEVDGKPACAVIPSDRTLSMKKVAVAFGAKSARMMPPDKAERLTGFHTGGISPFGQKRRAPVAFEASALSGAEIVLNGGRRGLMVALAPDDALAAAGAQAADLCAEHA
ncbi:aminoacyl-tRNA deacylase [Rhodovulum visakhapatnamense]|uniref:Cys-tRNA(Pro)/Cys-tRNA(Cys) deacylase n=1 Tax=Rhodovulum visakhapatnamense TaxID=364297 RepID=A0A4V3GUN3_9RHOB|nr:aminoacyl-tRNA deacylase [Rhodovulum visakhapatnamense]TDX30701.1 Cys-tRNA(Pro)/Cys-tRNA(Cys) deacylase [Rhodovulum visakhapatnamense]